MGTESSRLTNTAAKNQPDFVTQQRKQIFKLCCVAGQGRLSQKYVLDSLDQLFENEKFPAKKTD
jgi:hypothetical protein